jgi:mannose-6-phosphate isomerase-like protein (cupin superfamily)
MSLVERPAPPASSPRPTFPGPALIRRGDVTRHVWGDPDSGEVFDWIYASTDLIHMLVFGLAPGGAFRHSEAYRTVFAADEVLHVLEGTLVIADPQTGEVERVATGESVFFRRDTWHHAFALGPSPLRVLELFAPPPAAGASSAYAREQPYLETSR